MSDTFTAFLAEKDDDGFRRGLRQLGVDDLAAGDVVIDVEYSSVNYKDHLASIEKGRVARVSPLVPGIDLAGTVRSSANPEFAPGDQVIAGDAELGVSHHGGFAQVARVPADFVVPLPAGLTTREAMLVGTGGFTAAMSVLALLDHRVMPDSGTIVVTGATGGVGSMAVAMLAKLGFTVAASTGKPEAESYLLGLGASEIVDRAELANADKPLMKTRWASAVDAVGGDTLAGVLASLAQDGAVAASGNVGGFELHTTVMPFILRGVTLYGIDSAHMSNARRRELWGRVATDLKPDGLAEMERVVDLEHLEDALDEIGRGGVTGRYVVQL
jgi:putative YhdH/YhfP family quinone oxidoreductase